MAHIVGDNVGRPRGYDDLSERDRDRYENLILLCNTHHQLVDGQPETYTVGRLRAIKEDHERWVEQRLGQGSMRRPFLSLRFLRLADREWALSIRPELRVTEDGITPPKSELI